MKHRLALLTVILFSSIAALDAAEAPKLLPPSWDSKAAADKVMASLIKVSAPQVKGAHDAEFVCLGDRAYIVEHDNDIQPGHGAGKAEYCVLSVVNLKTLKVEKVIPMAKSGEAFENETLPVGACFVPRIIRASDTTLRCYFTSEDGNQREAQMWYRDFDLRTMSFAGRIHKAKLKTAAGVFDMQPQHFHADAAAQGFTKPAQRFGLYIFDSFKEFDGRRYVAINNFPGKQNALARVQDDLATFEVIGHYNEPQSQQLSESAVNRLPDGTWMAICRNDGGNYHFTTSKNGRRWSVGEPMPFVPNGLNSRPTFDKFGGVYYLGWQEATSIQGANRSVFNVDISRDGRTWERKYRFETPESFQYPTFHEHEGTIWLTVTQSDHRGSTDRIMFGKLEDVGRFESQAGKTRKPLPTPPDMPASVRPDRKWSAQATEDAKQDFTSIPYDGITPNKLVCDTTLRELPDGSWALFMLAGDDFEPSPKNYTGLTRSFDKGKTWSPLQPVDIGLPREGKTMGQGPTELMSISNRSTLFFSTHSQTWGRDWQSWLNRHRAVHYSAKLPPLP